MEDSNPFLARVRDFDKKQTQISAKLAANPRSVLGLAAITSLWEFINLISFKGGTSAFSGVHEELVNFITEPQANCTGFFNKGKIDVNQGRRRLVIVPRGHLKSTLCSVAYVLWRIYRNPNIRIAVGCATKELALQFVREIKQYLEDEDLQDSVWNKRPHVAGRLAPILDKAGAKRRDRLREEDDYTEAIDRKIVWRSDAIQVNRSQIMREPTVLATSPGSNVTGMHFDLFIKDDIINDDTVATEEKIKKTLEWSMDLESVLDPQRKVLLWKSSDNKDYWEIVGDEDIVLGTRYARHDYYDYLIENQITLGYKVFSRNIYKNGRDSGDGYLWQERFNDYVVSNLKRRLTPRRFASQYLNSIIVEEEQIFKMEKIQWIDPGCIEIHDGYITIMKRDQEAIKVFPHLVLDPAISQKKTADNTVMLVGGIDAKRNLYLFEFVYGKFLPEEMVSKMFALAEKWKVTRVTIEVVSFQKVIAHMVRSAFARFRPIGINEYIPRGEKKGRIVTYLEPLFDNHMIYADRMISTISQFREEIEYFTTATNSAVHDDFIDTMAILVEVAIPSAKRLGDVSNRVSSFPINRKYGGMY